MSDPSRLTEIEGLEQLIRRGETPGAWSDRQVRNFERECSEWIGEFGERLLNLVRDLKRERDELLGLLDNERLCTAEHRGYAQIVDQEKEAAERERDALRGAIETALLYLGRANPTADTLGKHYSQAATILRAALTAPARDDESAA